MQIKISKSRIPILWLDTSVIINLQRLRYGGSLKSIDRIRTERLDELLVEKVRQKKLLCPSGDQDEEYDFGKDGEQCDKIRDSLARGIHFRYRTTIQLTEMLKVAQAYIRGEQFVDLSYRDAFDEDPVNSIAESGPIVSVHMKLPEELIAKFGSDKKKELDSLENLRKYNLAKGMSFEQQLAIEFTATIQAVAVVLQRWTYLVKTNTIPTLDDLGQQQVVLGPLMTLINHFGSPQRVVDFLNSDDYKSIPYIEISRHLFAERVTSNAPIESGDSMDIEQVSTVIPYCDIVVTDRKMANRIKRFGFDKKFATKVYSMSECDDLLEILENV